MQAVLGDLEANGASLVALTPHLAEHSRAMRQKHGLNYHLLTDPGNAYAAELGLRFAFPEDLRKIYRSINIDLPRYNGDDSWTLPVPARFVVDPDGIVRAADVDVDYTRRPEPEKTLADVKALGLGPLPGATG